MSKGVKQMRFGRMTISINCRPLMKLVGLNTCWFFGHEWGVAGYLNKGHPSRGGNIHRPFFWVCKHCPEDSIDWRLPVNDPVFTTVVTDEVNRWLVNKSEPPLASYGLIHDRYVPSHIHNHYHSRDLIELAIRKIYAKEGVVNCAHLMKTTKRTIQ